MKKCLDLKSILALLMVGALIVGLFTNRIASQDFIPLVAIVLTFYFVKNKKRRIYKMAISLTQFVEENLGKKLNIPTPNPDPNLLGQCVSLVQQYLYQCLDIPFAVRGHAKEWVNTLPAAGIAVKVTGTPQAGDIIVYPTRGVINGITYGHIGVVISATQSFEQNVEPTLVAQKRTITTNSAEYVLLRPTGGEIPPVSNLTGIYLVAKNGVFTIRETAGSNGAFITTVPKGNEAQILEFSPRFISHTDGKSYQWAKVKYRDYYGYSQLDLQGDYLIRKAAGSSVIYMKAVTSAFRIRSIPVTGSYDNDATVLIGSRAEITSVQSNHASDGYQWAYVESNSYTGYSQMDTVGSYQLES